MVNFACLIRFQVQEMGVRSLRGGPFWGMTQGMALDEAVEFLGKIFSMIAGTFESLGHQQDLEAHGIAAVLG